MKDFEDEVLESIEKAVAQLPPSLQAVASKMDSPVFHSACTAGEIELVLGLLDAGLDPDMYPCSDDEDDEPPLTWIARYRDQTSAEALNVAQLLIDRGADANEGKPLLAAAQNNDAPMIRLLLAAGADPDKLVHDGEPEELEFIQAIAGSIPLESAGQDKPG